MSEYKIFAQRIGLIGISNILIGLSSLILLPFLTKNLSIQDYGVWIQFTTTVMFIPLLINMGLPYSMNRFLPSEKDKKNIQEGLYSITFILLFISLIALILIIIFSRELAMALFNDNIYISLVLSVSILINCVWSSFISFFKTFQQMKAYSIFSVIQVYFTVGAVILLLYLGYGISGVLTGYLIVQIIVLLFTVYFVIHQIGFSFPKFRNVKEYLSFGIPTVPGNLSYWMVDASDCYIIGIILGTTFVGYYAPGYTLGNIIIMFMMPFAVLLTPLLSVYYDQGQINKVKLYLNYSLKYFLLLSIPATFGLSLLSKPLLIILSTPEIANNGYMITPIVALSTLMYGIYGIISHILILEKKTKIIGYMWIIAAIINLVLNLLFVPIYGILAAAFMTLIAYAFTFLVSWYYSLKFLKFKFDYIFLMKCLFASLLMSIFIIFMNPINFLGIIITIVISSIIYIVIILLLKGIDKKEIKFLKELF